MPALDAGAAIRDVQTAGRWSDPRMINHYDRAWFNLDRSAVYAVSTFIAGVG